MRGIQRAVAIWHRRAWSGTGAGIVQEAMSHSSIAVRSDLYSHVVPSLQREASARNTKPSRQARRWLARSQTGARKRAASEYR